ncbi:MAG TPA: type II toxin-antitoxin system VapC family toxin [Candidatus Limnocylindria bacterium]|jgi:predicted nucleic acid-binding protein|nr:type II toxin-antitoxin system VapC family toxin [Candidatus Limnocylindria bacterium]
MLVVDANVIVQASIDAAGLGPLEGHALLVPPVMPSEALSALHEMRYRDEISPALAALALNRLPQLGYEIRHLAALPVEAWRIAEQLGWAKTYDAEYVALARLLSCPVVTLDGRLRRGAGRLVEVIGPGDITS